MKPGGKLVRDRIPEIIRRNNEIPHVRKLSPSLFRQALKEKLAEETEELRHAVSRQNLVEEIADVTEVLLAIEKAYDISRSEVTVVRRRKLRERGGFTNRLFLQQ